jgi:septal ring factor EnvC (AmiA/AmiB activator)
MLASEQQILASEQEILALEQQILALEQQILALEQQILALKQQILALEQQILAPEQEVTCFGASGLLLKSCSFKERSYAEEVQRKEALQCAFSRSSLIGTKSPLEISILQ